MSKRVSRVITNKEDIDFLLNIKSEDVTYSFINENFGKYDGKCRFNTYDIITIPKGYYGKEGKKNKNEFTTTVGRWIFNKVFIEEDFFDLLGYINKPITSGEYKDINRKLSYAIMEDKITIDILNKYLDRVETFMPYINIYSPGFTEKMLRSTKAINKKKDELYRKYKDRIDAGDYVLAEQMETELKEFAREYLKDDPSMDAYLSGATGSFDNNYKNMYIMKGAIKDPDPNKGYNIMMSNYMDGVNQDEYPILANSLSAGPYSRGKKTEVGGHWEKEFLYAYQHITLDKKGSDCGSTVYKKVLLTKDNVNMWMYSYMVENGKLVELNSDNMDKYIGKEVKFRFSAFCKSKTGKCNACMGNKLYKLGINNVGMATAKIPSVLKMVSMKAFHDSVVKTADMDVMKAFGYK